MINKRIARIPNVFLREDAQVRVLRFLWKSRAEWSGREIARKVGLSAPACHEALKKLNASGLVQFRRVSNVHLYQINPKNYLVEKLFARRFEAEAAMPGQMLAMVKKSLLADPKSDIMSIIVFGSMARGTEHLGSDLDILVVLPSKESLKAVEARIEKLRAALFERFSTPLSPYVQSLSELRHKHDQDLPLIREILKEGRTVYGKEIQELVS